MPPDHRQCTYFYFSSRLFRFLWLGASLVAFADLFSVQRFSVVELWLFAAVGRWFVAWRAVRRTFRSLAGYRFTRRPDFPRWRSGSGNRPDRNNSQTSTRSTFAI